jgi:serine/threonine protein kinase/tetratricopeptide (TPR) repeat protein
MIAEVCIMSEASIFVAALEKTDAAERAAYLNEACAGDEKLRRRVEALLRAHDQPEEHPDAPEPRVRTIDYVPFTESPGAVIGPYKLLQQIGEGGMGVVYMAEQEEPVRRKVALKIIKPGMDSNQVIARFEAERQALAMMDHQNIAHVLDAGTTASGRPYFVMELVKGVPITKFCDKNCLTPRERLQLFIPVCQAIQHAHQKGIIHRDIKPSNVMVTLCDGKPVPKVIDFGVAKATNQRLTERTMFTAYGQIVGTFEYMSPEQAEMSGLDVDTRSDIYSLGALLYELLTGSTPLGSHRLREAAFAVMLQAIKEEEPPKPSTRLSELGDALASISVQRKTEPTKLAKLMRGEIDWIVMKALEKDRGRRYESASGFARDIERYLSDEAVEACPPSTRYRLHKFLRRHRAGALTAAGFVLALVAGIVGTSIGLKRALAAERAAGEQLHRAEQAEIEAKDRRDAALTSEAKAVQEAAVARGVTSFLQQDLLLMADPEVQFGTGMEPDPEIKLRTLLERAESKVKERFANQPEVEASVRSTLAGAFSGIGDFARAAEQLAKVRAHREAHLGPDHLDTLASNLQLAEALQGTTRRPEAVPLSEQTLKLIKDKLGRDDPTTLKAMCNLAAAYLNVGRNAEALALYEETHTLMKARFGPDHPLTLQCHLGISLALPGTGRQIEALALSEEVHRLTKSRLGPNNPITHYSGFWLAMAYSRVGRVAEALPQWQENYRLAKATFGADHPFTLRTTHTLASTLTSTGRVNEALPLHEEAWRLSKAKSGADHHDTLWFLTGLARAYFVAKQPEKAIPLYGEYLAWQGKILNKDESRLAIVKIQVAEDFIKFGQFANAEKLLHESLAIRERKEPEDWRTFNTKSMLGASLLGQKRFAEAEPLLLAGYEGMKQRETKIPPEGKVRLTDALERLVQLHDAWGKKDEVAKWRTVLEEVKVRSKLAVKP